MKLRIAIFLILFSLPAHADLRDGIEYMQQHNYADAVKYIQPEAVKGNPEAQFRMCGLYYMGQGVPKNEYEAFNWCQQAANQGHVEAMYNLALFYQNGEGIGQNYQEATRWYKAAADGGHWDAQFNYFQLVNSNHNGQGPQQTPQHPHTASLAPAPIMAPLSPQMAQYAPQPIYNAPAPMLPAHMSVAQPMPPQQYPQPQFQSPQFQPQQMMPQQMAPQQMAYAPQQMMPPVLGGQIPATYAPQPLMQELAQPAQLNIPVQIPQQVNYIQPAPQQLAYAPPQPAPVQVAQASQAPAPQQPLSACDAAAKAGVIGDNCRPDSHLDNLETAAGNEPAEVTNLIKLADQENGAAQFELAEIYRKGLGVPQTPDKAIMYFSKLAEKGNTKAMINLGDMYKNGEGVVKNNEQAYAWYNLAADRMENGAAKDVVLAKLKDISPNLSNAQLGTAMQSVSLLDKRIPLAR